MKIIDNRRNEDITDGDIVQVIRGGSSTEIILVTGYTIEIPLYELEKIEREVE